MGQLKCVYYIRIKEGALMLGMVLYATPYSWVNAYSGRDILIPNQDSKFPPLEQQRILFPILWAALCVY